MQKGRSDMVFYIHGTAKMIEFKTETGKQSIDQKNWESLIKQNGFDYVVIRNLQEFKEYMTKVID